MIYHSPMYLFLEFFQHLVHLPDGSLRPKVLDCAAGGWVPPLGLFYENGFDTWGIDLSEEALDRARVFEKANEMQFHLQNGDMRQLPFLSQTFDLVYEFYSMVHLSHADIAVALAEMHRVLKPGGFCFAGFMSADTWPIEGEQVCPGEYALVEDGHAVIHSVFTDAEVESYLTCWKVLLTEKRITGLQSAMAPMSQEEWMANYPAMKTQMSSAEWATLYTKRLQRSRYVHTFVILQKE